MLVPIVVDVDVDMCTDKSPGPPAVINLLLHLVFKFRCLDRDGHNGCTENTQVQKREESIESLARSSGREYMYES